MSDPFEVQPLDKTKAPCKFGRWWNAAIPEEAPDLVFKCSATGGEWRPGTKGKKSDTESRCVRCILYQPGPLPLEVTK